MNVVGKVSSFITQGMYSVATPFHPFGGAVDIIVVKQQDGSFRSTPWYVRFGKFQGVLKGAEKIVRIEVNGVEADFNMYLDNSGEAYFVREIDPGKEGNESFKESGNSIDYDHDDGYKRNDLYGQEVNGNSNDEVEVQDAGFDFGINNLKRVDSDSGHIFYEFQDDQSSLEGSLEFSEYDSTRYDTLDSVEHALESQNSNSEVVLVSVDGHILTAPISSSEREGENVQLSTPQFHLGPGGRTEEYNTDKDAWSSDYFSDLDTSAHKVGNENVCEAKGAVLSSDNHLEPCEGHRELSSHAQENQKLINYGKDASIESLSPSTPDVTERDEIFRSCLELTELAVRSMDGHLETSGSSIEIHGTSEDPNNGHDQIPSNNHETENRNHEILKIVDESHPHESGSPISVSLSDSLVEAAIHERNNLNTTNDGFDKVPIQFDSNDQELQDKTEKNALDMVHDGFDEVPVQFDRNDQELKEKTDEDPMSESKQSDVHCPALDDILDEDGECHNIGPCTDAPSEDVKSDSFTRPEISLCGHILHAGMGLRAAEETFDANRISLEEFKRSASSIVMNECLIVRLQGKYLPWDKAAHIILGMATFGLDLPIESDYVIPVEQGAPEVKEDASGMNSTSSRRWRLWPIPFRRVKTLEHTISNQSNEEEIVDSGSISQSEPTVATPTSSAAYEPPRKQIRTNVPTSDQIASLNLKEGQNMVNFVFCTRVLGTQKVEAHIYLWKWNTRIVVSDVDGTITKSDVLGQFMPLVGKDWTHSGIARLFSAIKENGYQLLFLSARAIVQAYLTKSFLFNLKQDGKSLPNGPVVISPDGLFPSLYREVIRRAPHEFKIACLEDIKALFPSDYNPFYAGFGNRDTDELSYRKVGIPKGKIFIINPKGEVAINHRVDVKSYTSFHTLVHDMFPPTAIVEQEDYNSWNYWKMPLPDIEKL